MTTDTHFDEAFQDAELEVRCALKNEGGSEFTGTLDLSLKDSSGLGVAASTSEIAPTTPGTTSEVSSKLPVPAALKWNPEHPTLYTLTVTLTAQEKVTETIVRRVGLRTIQVRGNELFVNGRPLKLRGVCRHEVDPERGRSLTACSWWKDAQLFRDANVNYIRTSHYPPAEEFIDACDELGLFVEEEAPICWVGHGANAIWKEWNPQDTKYTPYIVQATQEMIARDRNHPSVLIWSLGNESLWGASFEKSLECADAADPTRPKSFHDQGWGAYNNNHSKAQIAVYHYPTPAEASKPDENGRPMLFGEYCHLNCYNREEIVTDPGLRDDWGRVFADMWEKMYAAQGCLGGAVWSGIDDVFYLPGGKTVGYGEWGPIDGWRRTKPEYWHFKMTYAPVSVACRALDVPADGQPIRIPVENRQDFTNLNELRIAWSLGSEQGVLRPDIPPKQSGQLEILPKTPPAPGSTLRLTFTSPRGFVIREDAIVLGVKPAEEGNALPQEVALTEKEDAFVVTAGGNAFVVNRATGKITAEASGKPILADGPDLMLLPIKGNGDLQMTGAKKDYPPFTDTCHDWRATNVRAEKTGADVQVTVEGAYKEAEGQYTLRFAQDGALSVDYAFTVQEDVQPRQIGLVFALPGKANTLAWERNAQWTVYPDGHIGRPAGTAKAFYLRHDSKPGVEPRWPWEQDQTPLGSNDFRATRRNICWAALRNADGTEFEVLSDGKQHARAWVQGDRTMLLIADIDCGSGEGFLSSHYADQRQPLTKGASVKGCVRATLR